jgi:hypothetical protein
MELETEPEAQPLSDLFDIKKTDEIDESTLDNLEPIPKKKSKLKKLMSQVLKGDKTTGGQKTELNSDSETAESESDDDFDPNEAKNRLIEEDVHDRVKEKEDKKRKRLEKKIAAKAEV